MMPLRSTTLVLLCALASACASTGNQTAPQGDATVVAADAAASEPAASVAVVDAAPAQASGVETEATPASTQPQVADDEMESDFAAIYGQPGGGDGDAANGNAVPVAYDPWEKYNRRVHAFNGAVDRAVAKPLARAYVAVVPRPVRTGVNNFFDNLGQPVTLVNSLLQGNPRGAANALGRFLLNSTIGIGGLFDMASKAKMPDRGEDFGQTMAVWGWQRSRYIEVPFLGPRTVRDMIGLAADTPLRPIRYLEDDKTRVFLQGLQAVDLRAQLLSIEGLMSQGAVDEYTLFRDMWLQRRNYQINQAGRKKDASAPDETLPPYLMQDDAVPAPVSTPGGE
ncbi:MAG: VacJ family lipoprotein [Thermomonas sp.]